MESNLGLNPEYESKPTFGAVIALGKNWRLPIAESYYHEDPILSMESKMTALAAGEMYKNKMVGKIIFGGGPTAGKNKEGRTYPTEAEAMKQFMLRHFPRVGNIPVIPEEDVLLENKSFDTAENAEGTKEIIANAELKNIALLTVKSHGPRAEKIFSNHGVPIKQTFSSEDILRGRKLHYAKFLSDYEASIRHHIQVGQEKALQAFLRLDRMGKLTGVLRQISNARNSKQNI